MRKNETWHIYNKSFTFNFGQFQNVYKYFESYCCRGWARIRVLLYRVYIYSSFSLLFRSLKFRGVVRWFDCTVTIIYMLWCSLRFYGVVVLCMSARVCMCVCVSSVSEHFVSVLTVCKIVAEVRFFSSLWFFFLFEQTIVWPVGAVIVMWHGICRRTMIHPSRDCVQRFLY